MEPPIPNLLPKGTPMIILLTLLLIIGYWIFRCLRLFLADEAVEIGLDEVVSHRRTCRDSAAGPGESPPERERPDRRMQGSTDIS